MEHNLSLFATATVLFALCAIAMEDLRYRSILWWWLPILALSLWCSGLPLTGRSDHLWDAGWNLVFLLLQGSGVALWWLLRRRSPRELVHQIGSGDMLFLVALALALPRWEFMLVLLSGLCTSLIAFSVIRRLRPLSDPTVPLAGLMSIHLGVWTLMKHLMPLQALSLSVPTIMHHG